MEISLVILIIAILVMIAMPMWNNAKGEAKNVSTMTTIRGVEKMVTAYSIDNGGSYPTSLSDIGQDSLRDPWGNTFQYTNLALHPDQAVIDFLGNPLNSDFDLYSKGPDGLTSTKDDIVRSGDGGFVGVASGLLP